MTSDLERRIQQLSSNQKKLLQKQLASKRCQAGNSRIVPDRSEAGTAPLSLQQRRLWTLTQFSPDSTAYNIPGVLSLSGPIDTSRLRRAMELVVAQQGLLRSVIGLDGDQPVLHIHSSMPVPFSEVQAEEPELEASVRAALNRKFQLMTGPLWQAVLLRVRNDRSVLALSFHHIIFDGWSLGVFVNTLFETYAQLARGPVVALPELEIQFTDFSRWQVGQLGAIRERDAGYWCGVLASAPPVLDLFSDGRKNKSELQQGAMHRLTLERQTFDRAKALARSRGTTPFNFFQAVLRVLIYRYSGVADTVIGTPVSGRELAETHGLVGLFVNTLPVRVRLEPAQSFEVLLETCRLASSDAFEHGDLPFDTIVEVLNPERMVGCNPIFQVLYTYQNQIHAIELPGVLVRYESTDIGTSKFDLSLDVFEDFDGATCLFEYDTQVHDAGRIQRLAVHFANLVNAVLETPEVSLDTLTYLTVQETECALQYVQQSSRPLVGPQTFPEAFRRQVDQNPQAPCVIAAGVVQSYAKLDQDSTRLAAALYDLGVRRGGVVGLCLHRSSSLIQVMVATLQLGASFLVLDPALPMQRLEFMISDSDAYIVVADDDMFERLNDVTVDWVSLSQLVGAAHALNEEEILTCQVDSALAPRPSDIAYLVYTSGTTGTPKAVAITHANWMNALAGWTQAYELSTKATRHLQMASPGFDVFCGDFVRALGSGGCLVICPQTIMSEPSELYALIVSERINCAEFVPAVFRNLADWLSRTSKRLEEMALVVVASDAWYMQEYRQFKLLLGPNTKLVNSYGLAEATIDSTWYEASLNEHRGEERLGNYEVNGNVPIGIPFPNVEVLILDERGNLMPPGVPGEICIGGRGLANGYLKRPELTAQRFVPHPFSTDSTARLYRTGDIGLMRVDGLLELRGRRDLQIKIRGQRIELGEVENALVAHEAVAAAVATVHDSGQGTKSIAAYYVKGDAGQPLDQTTLRRFLERRLPAFMLPAHLIEIGEIPTSVNGKVDRKALPKPSGEGSNSIAFVSPTTLVQEQLASIWCQVLAQPRVGTRDSFFELGGHSLLAFQVIGRIKQVFGVELPIHTLFSSPTIAEIEKVVLALQGMRAATATALDEYPSITPDSARRYEPFPLTEVQQAYWLGRNDVFEFGNVTTHSYDELETEGLDVARFEAAWQRVIDRHDMLRAVVREDGSQQVLQSLPAYRFPIVDLRNAGAVELQRHITELRNEMSHQKLDVSRWPVFDMRISLLPDNKARVHFSTDALIWDAWSFATLIHDLVCFYVGETHKLSLLELTFRDYVLAEKELMQGEKYRRAVAYWKDRIAELPPAPILPMAKSPDQLERPRFTRLHRAMDPERWDRLKLKATKRGMTATGITLAAYAEILATYAQDPRFSLNLTFLSRHPLHAQVNDVVGEFTSLTLLAVDNSTSSTFTERARKIQSDLWHDLEHHYVSGVHVLRELGRQSGDATRAKMPVVFTSALVVPIPERHPDLPMTPVYRDGVTQTSQVWLDCGVWEDQRWLLCNWDVVLELYPEGFAEEMFEAYWTLLVRLADDETVWDMGILTCGERAEHLSLLDNALRASAFEETLVSMFLRQARKAPDDIALVDSRTDMTYLELMGHVTWVQRELLRCGIRRGELVAIFMHKGWEQVAASLGAMAAGAAYVPIDPELPVERIRFLLAQCNVKHAISQPSHCQLLAVYTDLSVHILDQCSRVTSTALSVDALPRPSDIAYVIFTSGSTGQPKGVVVDHRGAVNTIVDVNDRFGVGPEDSALAVSALSFDLSVYDIFGMLAAGGKIVIPENDRRLDPVHWVDLMVQHGVTVWNSVPALAGLLLDYLDEANERLDAVRWMLLSGDWIPLSLPSRASRRLGKVNVVSLGGATEASIWSVVFPIRELDAAWVSIPYGCALKGQTIQVLDHRLEPRPNWVTGEIYIGGIGLAVGYWRDPELTAKAFVTHPQSGQRLYKTGDLGRRLPDGNLEILGRTDFQVKIQGHRIELGEIESALAELQGVKQAIVVASGEQKGDKRLIGYVVAEHSCELSVEHLRQHLRGKVPYYMVPAAISVLEQLPLTANGKVDRARLGTVAAPEASCEHVAPHNDWEFRLQKLWCDVLGVESIGVRDQFASAGGDSMSAVRLLTSMHREFGYALTLREVFNLQTVEEQARRMAEACPIVGVSAN